MRYREIVAEGNSGYKFWIKADTGEMFRLPHGEHTDFLDEIGVTDGPDARWRTEQPGYYYPRAYTAAQKQGWVAGFLEDQRKLNLAGQTVRLVQKALRHMLDKYPIEVARVDIDPYNENRSRRDGFGMRGHEAIDYFLKTGKRPPLQMRLGESFNPNSLKFWFNARTGKVISLSSDEYHWDLVYDRFEEFNIPEEEIASLGEYCDGEFANAECASETMLKMAFDRHWVRANALGADGLMEPYIHTNSADDARKTLVWMIKQGMVTDRVAVEIGNDGSFKMLSGRALDLFAKTGRFPALIEEGVQARTGQPITLPYMRNLEKAPYLGAMFAQDIEPAGEYMNVDDDHSAARAHAAGKFVANYRFGTVTFKNPLVLDHISTAHGGWKTTLSRMFGGLTGRKLSAAIMKAGHDGIITVDVKYGYEEIVNLAGTLGEVGLTESADGADDADKFWYNPPTGEYLSIGAHREHIQHLKDIGVPLESRESVIGAYREHRDIERYFSEMMALGVDAGWVRGGYFGTQAYLDANTEIAARKALRALRDVYAPRRVDISINGESKGIRLGSQKAMDLYIRYGRATEMMAEAVDSTYRNQQNTAVRIFRNPSRAEVQGALSRAKYGQYLRGALLPDGNVMMWDGGLATHWEIAQFLGYALSEIVPLEMSDDRTIVLLHNHYFHSDDEMREIEALMRETPMMRIFDLKIEEWSN